MTIRQSIPLLAFLLFLVTLAPRPGDAFPFVADAPQQPAAPANPFAQDKAPAGPVTTIDTPHLTVATSASDEKVSPGSKVSLSFDITPRRGIHVYAPGKHTYQVVRVTMDPQAWLRTSATTYPRSEIYHFEPLDERGEVYH